MIRQIKRLVFNAILRSPIYPHIYFFANPFKFYEFYRLMQVVPIQAGDRLLDIGCGSGLQTNLLGRRCAEVVGIDISKNDIDRALSEKHLTERRINSRFLCTSIEKAGFPDASFDKVYSICVLEHIPDYRSVLREAFRVLKPGGSLVMSVDSLATIVDPEAKRMHRERYRVVDYFVPEHLAGVLKDAGFTGVSVEPILKSAYAAQLFTEGIRRDWKYRYREAVGLFRKLEEAEKQDASGKDGIYLIVHARKA